MSIGNQVSGPQSSEIELLRRAIGKYFSIYEIRISQMEVVFHIRTREETLEENFDALRKELLPQNYVPTLTLESGEHIIHVMKKPSTKSSNVIWNIILLAGTICTTTFAGMTLWAGYIGITQTDKMLTFGVLVSGILFFAIPLMVILGVHELGHYFAAKRHGVSATLPYFIPVPPPFLFGTMGAFISIKEPIPNKKALLDIGVAGPICGFIAAIPVTVLGLYLSTVFPPTITDGGGLILGSSLLFDAISRLVPFASEGIHPMAIAGWVGLFVTAINLLPAGQLDGGHIVHALLGTNARYLGYIAIFAMLIMSFIYPGWLLFAFLVIILGLRHPPPLNTVSKLDSRRKLVGIFAIFILLSSFVVVPIRDAEVDFAVDADAAEKYLSPDHTVSFNVSIVNLGEIYARYSIQLVGVQLTNNSSTIEDRNYKENLTLEYFFTSENGTSTIKNTSAETQRTKPGEKINFEILVRFNFENYSEFNFAKLKFAVRAVGIDVQKEKEFTVALKH
ncbi:MAG: site-2 protease family protein [Thermoplasmata archaeon]